MCSKVLCGKNQFSQIQLLLRMNSNIAALLFISRSLVIRSCLNVLLSLFLQKLWSRCHPWSAESKSLMLGLLFQNTYRWFCWALLVKNYFRNLNSVFGILWGGNVVLYANQLVYLMTLCKVINNLICKSHFCFYSFCSDHMELLMWQTAWICVNTSNPIFCPCDFWWWVNLLVFV